MNIRKKSNYLLQVFLLVFIFFQIRAQVTEISLNSISIDVEEANYKIESKVLTLNNNGNYKISGTCTQCQIVIKKGIEVEVTLSSITIDNSITGPFVIKKEAIVNLILEGESKITDNEPAENENSEDEEIKDAFEGAGIKFKSSSSLTISGDGKLNVIGNTKNGIKGAALSTLIINSGEFVITASKNALACDHLLTINGGDFDIRSESDGIKSEPDEDDAQSQGTITINGGDIKVITQSDAIQAAYKLLINGGSFNIKTYNGAVATNFDKDTMSAKGLKCSTNEHENVENELTITGGSFILDTSDDAIHSDYNITITGGTFDIQTGDDGVHADQYLVLGKLNSDDSLINLKITKSYEGLEGSYIYIYSGTYNIIASDDGINSAGDTDENCNTQGPGGQGGPNQGGQGEPGQGEQGGPGQEGPGGQGNPGGPNHRILQSQCLSFHTFIFGGKIYVNTESDGIDANGDISISGGNLEIWGMTSGGDGDPIDKDGTLSISGGTILAGGSQGMNPIHKSSKNIAQNYIYCTSSFNANKEIKILDGDKEIKTITIPKRINYLFYTSKETNSNYKFSEGNTNFGSSGASTSSSSLYFSSLKFLFTFIIIFIFL